MPWGTGSGWKNRLFSKTVKNSKKAKHSFVDACITHCPKPVRFNNSQQKVLPLFSDRVESRDNICIIEKHRNRKHTCMYLAKSHLSRAYVLRDRAPPITFSLYHLAPMPSFTCEQKEFLSAAVEIAVNLDFWCSYKSKNDGGKLFPRLPFRNSCKACYEVVWSRQLVLLNETRSYTDAWLL